MQKKSIVNGIQYPETKKSFSHIIAEHKKHSHDPHYESFQYRIQDDIYGIVTREEGFTGRYLLDNGGILEVKPVDVGPDRIPTQISNKEWEYYKKLGKVNVNIQ